MRKLILSMVVVALSAITVFAQVPEKLNYQGVARDNAGNVLATQSIGLQIKLHSGSGSGPVVYTETHTVTTNAFGLFNVQIGSGANPSGTIAAINWGGDSYFVEVGLDASGGTTYTSMGNQELLSVPYALYAKASATPGPAGPTGATGATGAANASGTLNYVSKFTAATTLGNSQIFDDGTNVGIGTTTPLIKLQVEHGGGTGILSKSTASFSTLDVDAANGDASVRLLDAGDIKAGMVYDKGNEALRLFTYNAPGNGIWMRDIDGNVGIGITTPSAKLEVAGQVKINGGTPGAGKLLSSDATGLGSWSTGAALGLTSGTGTTNYVPKWTSASNLGVSLLRDNGTNMAIGDVPSTGTQFLVTQTQLTADGVGQASIYGLRTRDSRNDGTGYTVGGTNLAVKGYNFWGDSYTFGVGGFSWNDYARSGGVLGTQVNGLYWGSLGYKSSANITYGVYGSAAYASGTGRMANGNAAGIGGGFYGDLMGGWVRGDIMGLMTSGSMFSSYNVGNEYTEGKQIELITNANGQKMAAYTITAANSKVYGDGTAQLVNGTAHVNFDAAFAGMVSSGKAPTVTLSPLGGWANLYILSSDATGFTVAEANNGSSSISFNWIAVADRVDGTTEVPAQMLESNFKDNMTGVMFNEGNKEQSGQPIFWNGKELKYAAAPSNTAELKAKELARIKAEEAQRNAEAAAAQVEVEPVKVEQEPVQVEAPVYTGPETSTQSGYKKKN